MIKINNVELEFKAGSLECQSRLKVATDKYTKDASKVTKNGSPAESLMILRDAFKEYLTTIFGAEKINALGIDDDDAGQYIKLGKIMMAYITKQNQAMSANMVDINVTADNVASEYEL